MTDEIIEADQPLTGTKRAKKKSLIGIDPLAWLNDEVSENEQAQVTEPEIEAEIIEQVQEEISEEVMEVTDQKNMEEEVTDMEIQQTENSTDGNFKLEGPITIADVAELHEQFKTYLAQDKAMEIDCSEVAGVDAAALQLLVALVNEAENQDKQLIWKEPSDSLQATVQMMGLNDQFKI